MSLNFFTILFFLLNFYHSQNIEFDINCDDDEYQYYNSLEYECQPCNGIKGISNDICYNEGLSIYTFTQIEIQECDPDEVFTELDVNKNLLLEPQCVSTIFNFDDVDPGIFDDVPAFSDSSINIPIDQGEIYDYKGNEIKYYYSSCLKGKYEPSCDFFANLCTLSLYYSSVFCDFINNELNSMLRENGIL